MKIKLLSLALVPLLSALTAAQTPPTAPASAASATAALPAPKEDFKPASSNLAGKEYPQVNSERRVRYRVVAPLATSVKVGSLELTKGQDGAWMGTSEPRDEGSHFYTLNIDGAEVPDPNSIVVGVLRLRSIIEIPAADQDFYALKNVPHGQMREVRYFAKSSNSIRRIYVYTPPDYDKDLRKRYPVLYLQHGATEDETLWHTQGRTGLIMDNLIAAGKAKPFIVVMEGSANTAVGPDGAAVPPAAPAGRGGAPAAAPAAAGAAARGTGAPAAAAAPAGRGGGGLNFSSFEHVLIDDLIPYVDANFRTLANQANRGMAGLSLGGMQTRSIGLSHLDQFSHIGVFSGGSITAEQVAAIPNFKEKVKLVFVSYGSREIDRPAVPRGGAPGGGRGGNATTARADIEALKQAGINARFYVSPETAHEWQSWRRSLHEFAQLVFKDQDAAPAPTPAAAAQPSTTQPAAAGVRAGRGGGLAPTAPQAPEENMAAYPVPPEGFKTERPNIPHGELKVVEYDSKTLGTRRLMRVYTPPGYSTDRKYPVLYLHHGLGNTSTEWLRAGAPI
ncbi:MAG: alpha/beta hydrolase-fold protein, partial [Vicinamibacterales bacterium]